MLRSIEERQERQEQMRDALDLKARITELLTVKEAAQLMHVSDATVRRLLRREPGVNLIQTPGSRRAIMRIHRSIVDRILRRTANR